MIEQLMKPNESAAPRRKFRGKKRYFRTVHRNAEQFNLHIGTDWWWDLWHYHADWPGWGNRSWRYRMQHLEALKIVFRTCASALVKNRKDFQIWIMLNQSDAGQDAVFLHSPNPNGISFPIKFENAVWGHPDIERLLPDHKARAGIIMEKNELKALLYVPGIGFPIE